MAKTSPQGEQAIISHEAIVPRRYLDSVRVWTIGIGHTAAAGGLDPRAFTGTLTIPAVLELFRDDLPKYEAAVNRLVKVPLKQHQFDALVSFHFNTGKLGGSTLLRRLNAGDYEGAEREFDKWHKPASVKGRRDAEKLLFGEGIYPPPFANVYPASASGKVLWSKGKRIDLRTIFHTPVAPAPTTTPAPTPAIDTHSQTEAEQVKMTPAKVETSTKITKTGTASIISLITAAVAAAWAYFAG